ncbi:MAG: hypothetical protein WBB29_05075 [Geitlerinemataceae cyanobacterium]
MYYYDPPYFLVVAGLFIGLTCGSAFYTTLVRSTQEWSKQRSSRLLASLQGAQLLLPFLGVSVGSCVFLASSLQIFSLPASFAYLLSLIMTLLVNGLIWAQLQKLLAQLEEGGSKAIDLDSLSLGEIQLPSQE